MRFTHLLAGLTGVLIAACAGGCRLSAPARTEIPLTAPREMPAALEQTQDHPPVPVTQPASAPAQPQPPDEHRPSSSPAQPDQAPPPDTGPAATRPAGERLRTSILQVGKSVITVEDVLRLAHGRLAELPQRQPQQAFRRQALQIIHETIWGLACETLVLPEAERRLSDEQKARIDREMDDTLRQMIAHSGSRAALEQQLDRQGAKLQDVLADHRRALTVGTYLQAKFAPAIDVRPRMLWDHYRRNIQHYSTPKKVQMQLIAVPFRSLLPPGGRFTDEELAAARAQARAIVEQARSELRDGKDFGEVAGTYSRGPKAGDDGTWPAMQPGSFKEKTVEGVAFALDEGQVSDIIETDSGCYIVKAKKVEPTSARSFEEAQSDIEAQLRADQHRTLTEDYYRRLVRQASGNAGADDLASLFAPGKLNEFTETALDLAVERHWSK